MKNISLNVNNTEPEWTEDKRNYAEAVDLGKRQVNKIINDLLNKYKSLLQEEKTEKIGKTISQEKIIDLTARVEVLEELKSKI